MTSYIHKAFAPLKDILPKGAWQPLRQLGTALFTPLRFAFKTGHFRSSLLGKACTPDGEPQPWYTYPAIDFLAPRDFTGKRVLEFGGGQSTLWWSKRAARVVTVDSDADWAAYVRANVGPNVEVHHVPIDRSTRTVEPIREIIKNSSVEKFDVIVIDGHLREELVAVAFDHIAPNGAVIMDNAEGYRFVELLRGRNCRRVDFFGFAPGSSMRSCTSIAWVNDCFLISADAPMPAPEFA